MLLQESLLVTLVKLVDGIPMPAPPTRGRGRPPVYPDRLFLKALVIMMVRRLHKVNEFLAVLAEPTPEMHRLRGLLTDPQGRVPSRRTWERRLAAVPATLPAQIGCLGRHLVARLQPWTDCGRAVAIASTVLAARGGVWHKKHRAAGVVPHTSIDTEAHSHQVRVARLGLRLEAAPGRDGGRRLAPAPGGAHARECRRQQAGRRPPDQQLPADIRFVLGEQPRPGPRPGARLGGDRGLDVRGDPAAVPTRTRTMGSRSGASSTRSAAVAIENVNGQFKAIFDVGEGRCQPAATSPPRGGCHGAVLVYQLTLLSSATTSGLRCGLKPFLQAA